MKKYDITDYEINCNDLIIYYTNGTHERIDYSVKNEKDIKRKMEYARKNYDREICKLMMKIYSNENRIEKNTIHTSRNAYYKDPDLVSSLKEDIKVSKEKLDRLQKELLFLNNERIINNEILRQYNYLTDEENEEEIAFMSIDDINNYTKDELEEIIALINSSNQMTLKNRF